MHELSLVEGIATRVATLKKEHGFNRVREIEIVCGQHHALSPENLEFFLSLEEDVCLQEARVSVVRLTKKYYCVGCGREFDSESSRDGVCAQGHVSPLVLATRHVLNIRKLEVD